MFDYFNHRGENNELSDKSLTQELLVLLLLLGGQKMNTVYFFAIDRMTVTDIGVTFLPSHVLKHLKPGKKLDCFHYRAYHNKKLCVVDYLKEYLKRRSTKVQKILKLYFNIWQTFQGSSNRFNGKMAERPFHRNVHSERIHTTHL